MPGDDRLVRGRRTRARRRLDAVPVLRAQGAGPRLRAAGRQVRVRASAVGGGFGGKEDFPSLIALHAALLARAAAGRSRCLRPPRGHRRHHQAPPGDRPPPHRRRRATAARSRSTSRSFMDGGAYTTLSPVVLSRALLHAFGPYRCADVRVRGRVLRDPHGAEQRLPRLRRAAGRVRDGAPDGPHRPHRRARSVRDPRAQRRRAGRPAAHRPGPRRERPRPASASKRRSADRLPRPLAGARGGAVAARRTASRCAASASRSTSTAPASPATASGG